MLNWVTILATSDKGLSGCRLALNFKYFKKESVRISKVNITKPFHSKFVRSGGSGG
jgi:hypothetical protein